MTYVRRHFGGVANNPAPKRYAEQSEHEEAKAGGLVDELDRLRRVERGFEGTMLLHQQKLEALAIEAQKAQAMVCAHAHMREDKHNLNTH